ncbi:MAG TPA: hypothetical protein VHW26_14015, partial [Solirubrobacteraceae bacterium]|nr:hypothetical protein [Solirubrobacteraceae bacterium]
ARGPAVDRAGVHASPAGAQPLAGPRPATPAPSVPAPAVPAPSPVPASSGLAPGSASPAPTPGSPAPAPTRGSAAPAPTPGSAAPAAAPATAEVTAGGPPPDTGPKRRRSATVHRSSAADPGTSFPALATILGPAAGHGSRKSLRAVLPAALSTIGEESSWDAVAIWHETQSNRPLTCLGIWTRRGPDLDWFETVTWRAKLERGDGPSSDLDDAGRLTWVSDLGNDGGPELSARERSARAVDLACRVVVPLQTGRTTVGALEVLAQPVRQPDDASVARLTSAAGLLTPLLLRDMHEAEHRRWRV